VVDFAGRFDRIDRAALVPKPTAPVPIWLGGSSEVAYKRAARLADGFIFIGGGIDHTIETWTRLRDRVRQHGRPVEAFGGDYVALPQGGVGEAAAAVDSWREAGGTHVSVATMGLGLDSADAHVEYLASIADALSLS
jgi:Luciferase-like monooxygenase